MGCSVSWFAAQRPKEDLHTHTRALKDVTLQDATVNAACGASVQVTGKVMEPRENEKHKIIEKKRAC